MKNKILQLTFIFACLSGINSSFAQAPANDNCTGAQLITPNGTCVNGTTVSGNDSWTNTVGCQTGGGGNSHEDVWYRFVATGTSFNSIVTTSGAWTGNVEFILAEGTCAGGFTLVNSSCGTSPLTVNATGLTIGTTYYFTISNQGSGTNGPFQVCTTTSNPPVNCTDNDDCNSPTIIPVTPNVQSCVTDCNTGAAPGPDFTGVNCYDFLNETVWYQVTTGASSAIMDINLSSTSLTNPYFSVFTTTDCANYTIVNCTQGASGSATNSIPVSGNTTYLIAISDAGGLTGNFDLCVNVLDDNSACNTNNQLSVTATSMGSPLTGPYQPGEVVTFCYTITDWQQINCNYLQGIVPTFGDCWDPVSFNAQGMPVNITTPLATAGTIQNCPPGPPCAFNACEGTSGGTWSWFPAGSVNFNSTAAPLDAGWFFLTSYSSSTGACTGDPTDPDNSYGDGNFPACGVNTLDWTVCFQLQARSSIGCTNGQVDCSVTIKTYADGEIGVWPDAGCTADIPTIFNSTLACCTPPTANAGSDISVCSNVAGTIGSASVAGMTYSWAPTTGLSSSTSSNPTITLTNNTAAPVVSQYIVTVTETATGCSNTDTVLVTVNPIPNVTVSGTTAICVNNSTTLTASGASTYTWSPSTALSATTGAAVDADPVATTTYTVTGTSAAGCWDTTKVIVRVTTINASISSKSNVLCNGVPTGTATISGSGGVGAYGYTWNSSPVQNTPTATGLAAGTYTGTVSNSGCSDTAIVVITQPSLLTVSTSPTNPTCNLGTNGSATANPLGGTGAYTYSWNTTPAQTTATATGLAAGGYNVTVTDANGCTATAVATLNQPTAITVGTSTTNTNCSATTGTATANPSGGTGAYTYSWATTPAQTIQTATGLGAGAYNVTVTDANGCTGVGTATVSNNNAPTVSISSFTNVLCNGASTGSVTVSASGGTGAYTYSWNTTPVQTTATASGLPDGTYAVTVTDAANCSASISQAITEPAAINVTTTPTQPLCNGGTGSATANVSGGTGAYTYSWNTSPAQTNATATGLAAGNYTVQITDANGCTNSAGVTITAPAVLTVTTSTTPVTCNGGVNGTATANPSGGTGAYTYSWSTSPVQTSATASGLTSNNYTVQVTDANGCTATATANVTQPTALTASITSNVPPSCNAGTNGSATVTPNGGTGSYTYSWNTTPAQTTATATGLANGSYSVLITDANGCTTTANVTITQPTALNVTVTGTNPTCNAGTNGSASTTVTGGTGSYTYSWNTTPVQNTANATGLSAGAYSVTVTDANGCSAPGTVTLTAPTVLAVTTTVTNVSCNLGTNGTATANPTGGTGTYTYSWNTTPAQTTSTATGLAAGSYIITITDANGCTANATANITEPAVLDASISAFTNVLCNLGTTGSATASAAGGTGTYTYSWNTSPAQTTATATGLAAGSYQVTITDANGCTDTAPVTITEPTALTVGTTATNTNCGASTGTATATPSGGTGLYTYSWGTSPVQTTQTATGLAAAAYNVTVTDANGCTASSTASVNNNGAPTVSISSTVNATCFGATNGSLTVTASGGTGAYTYSWNTSPSQNTATASNLSDGSYSVTVTDAANCTASITGTVTEPAELIATLTGTDPLCNGGTGSASSSVTGGTGTYTYSWSTTETTASISTLAPGNYTLVVTDENGCTDSESVTTSQPAAIIVTADSTVVSCFGGMDGTATATVANGVGSLDYSWSTSPVQISPTATGLTAGVYVVTVTDDNNCTGTVSIEVTEPADLTAIISSSTNVLCNAGTTGSATVTAGGGTGTYTYSWDTSPSQNTATASNLGAGVYNVTVTDANGCTETDDVTIQEPNAVSVTETITDASCAGNDGIIDLVATGGSGPYQFSIDNGTTFQASGTFSSLAGGTYQAVVTDLLGCSFTASYQVNTSGSLTASITTQTNATCAGVCDGTATVTASGGTGNYTYSWDTSPVQTTQTATAICAGTYDVTITEEVASGGTCSVTTSVTISEPSALTATTSSTDATCGSSNGTATVNASGGTGTLTYSWNSSPSQSTATATGLAAGNYNVTVTDENNCSITESVTVATPGGLTVSITSTTNVTCNGAADGEAVATASGGTAPYTIEWNPGATATLTNVVAGVYTVTVTDATGCTSTNTATITEPDAITLTTSFVQPTCNSLTDGSATVNATGGTGVYTYSWDNTQTTSTATNVGAGTYNVLVTDENGCTENTSVQVTEPAVISFTVTPVHPLCFNDANGSASVTNVSGGTGAYTYSWSDGTTGLSTTNLSAGVHSVKVTDANNCSFTQNFTLINPASITATTNVVNVLCFGDNTGSATVSNIAGGNGSYQFTWNTSPVQNTATATGLIAGNYTVTVTDGNNCTFTDVAVVTEPAQPLVTIASGQALSCANANDGQAAEVSTTGGTTPYTYSWNTTATTPSISNLATGTYTLLVTDNNGCIAVDTAEVTSPASITASGSSVTADCGIANGSASVSASGGTGTLTYTWQVTPVVNGNTLSPIGEGIYNVTITDANGCSISTNVTVAENPGPEAAFTATPTEGLAPLAVVFTNESINATTFTWTFGNGLTEVSPNASTTYAEEGSYVVLLTAMSGACTDTISKTITVTGKSMFEIPNVFTPDNDGSNDVFSMVAKNITSMHMQVFNRWGEKVFDREDSMVAWDGRTASGVASSAGTYYYIITAKGSDNVEYGPVTGFVTLVRK